jgi:hypothetical protein
MNATRAREIDDNRGTFQIGADAELGDRVRSLDVGPDRTR